MKQFKLFLVLIIAALNASSQNSLSVNTNMDLGFGLNSYGDNKNTLKGRTATSFNSNVSLVFTTADRFTFEIGLGQASQRLNMKDKRFASIYPDYLVQVKNKTLLPNFYGSVGYTRPITSALYSYGKMNVIYNSISASTTNQSFNYTKLSKNITANTNYIGSNFMLAPEFGLEVKTPSGFHFHVGVKLAVGLNDIIKGNYNVNTVREDSLLGLIETSDYSDTYSSKLSWIGINFGVNYDIFKNKKEESQNLDEIVVEPVIVTPSVQNSDTIKVAKTEPKVEPIEPIEPKPTKPKVKTNEEILASVDLPEREVKIERVFHVKKQTVILEIFDGAVEDGDTVSVRLNNKWIIYNYPLTKVKGVGEIQLKEGSNILELYAHNLGRIKPNTARIYIVEGRKRHIMTVRSNLGYNGAIEIIYDPKNK